MDLLGTEWGKTFFACFILLIISVLKVSIDKNQMFEHVVNIVFGEIIIEAWRILTNVPVAYKLKWEVLYYG